MVPASGLVRKEAGRRSVDAGGRTITGEYRFDLFSGLGKKLDSFQFQTS